MGWQDAPIVAPAPPAKQGWQAAPIVDDVDPAALNYDIPPTDENTVYADPAERQLTVPEALSFGSQAALRGLGADLPGAVYDLPNAIFMGTQWLANKADQLVRDVPDKPPVGLGEALGGLFGADTGGPSANLSDAIADTASDFATALGVPPTDPKDMAGFEPFYNPIRFAAGAAGGGTMLAQGAKELGERVLAGGRPRATDAFLRPYVDEPRMAIGRDTAAGAGAGAGADMSPDEGLMAFLGPLLGALSGSAGFGGFAHLFEGGRRFLERSLPKPSSIANYDPATGTAPTWGEIDQASRIVQGYARDPQKRTPLADEAAETLMRRAGEFESEGLPVPTAGLLSENLGLQELETAYRTKHKVPFIQSDDTLRSAASERVGSLRDPGADQSAVGRAAEGARLERMAPFTQDLELRRAAVDDVASGLARESSGYEPFRSRPDHYRTEASRNLDDVIVNEAYIPLRERKNELYRSVDPDRAEFVSIEPMRADLQQLRNQINEFGPEALQLPADFVRRIQAVLDRAEPDQDMMASIGELAGLRPFLSTAQSKARAGGNFDLADNIRRIQESIDGVIGDHPAAAEANRFYRDEFAPTFRPGPGDEAAKFTKQIDREPFGEGGVPTRTQTPPERTGDRFLRSPEKAAAVDRMIQAAPNPERGRAAVRDYFMADFAGSVFNSDGSINPQRATAWLNQNEPTLGQFPDLLRDFEQRVARAGALRRSAQDADEALTAARTRLEQEGRTVERGAIGVLLNEDPRDVAKGLLTGQKYNAGQRFREIDEIIGGDETARRGWRAAVSEVLSDMTTGMAKSAESGEYEVSLAKLSAMMKRHEDDLALVFDEAQMNTLRQGHKLLEVLRDAARTATRGSNTAEKEAGLRGFVEKLKNPLEVMLKARYGVLKGGGILRTVNIALQSLPNNQAAVERLIERAFFDPEIMEFLLTNKVGDMSMGASNKYVRGLLATYVAGQDDNAPEEE